MIRTTVVCLPVRMLERTLGFYRNVLGLPELEIEDEMIVVELPNLSLFLMETTAFEIYSSRAGRGARFPGDGAGMVISCAVDSREAVDAMLARAAARGGTVPGDAAADNISGGYTGYFADPDGHLWELVLPQPRNGEPEASQ